jgi:lantibiotic biosynthesis protein
MFSQLIPDTHELYPVLLGQIEDIARDIEARHDTANDGPGLLAGKAGSALLYAYLYKALQKPEYFDIAARYIDELTEILSTEELSPSMSSGVAGIAFTFQHLRNIDFLDVEDDLNLGEMDEFVMQAAQLDKMQGNWDPLHGLTALGVYFLERYKETKEPNYLEQVVDFLYEMRVPVNEYQLWYSPAYTIDDYHSPACYNFGMAHGMPGILSLLAQIYSLGIRQEKIEEMVHACLPYILKHRLPAEETSAFPSRIEAEQDEKEKQDNHSRLGWCYGDPCIVNMLFHLGKAFNNSEWSGLAEAIGIHTTNRTFENSSCGDAGFCHGSVGIAFQHNRMYQLTQNEMFKTSCLNWIETTLEKYYHKGEAFGGYYRASYDNELKRTKQEETSSFLDGSGGIALSFLSFITPMEPGWDAIYFTNI